MRGHATGNNHTVVWSIDGCHRYRVGVHQFVTDAYYDKKQRGPWQHSAPHRGSVISVR